MTRRWNGVRPYPNRALSLEAMEASREAYDLAMNSDTVQGLYKALKRLEWANEGGCYECPRLQDEGHYADCRMAMALAAYEKDLVPEPEEERHASR